MRGEILLLDNLGTSGPRPYLGFASVQADKTKEALAEFLKEVRGIRGERPVTPDELSMAQSRLTLSLPGRWETARAVAGSIGEIVRFRLGDDYFDGYAGRVRQVTNVESGAFEPAVSPDGRTAAVSDGEGRVVFLPIDGAEPRLVPGLEPGDVPMRWSVDGGSLFVFRFDELPARIRKVELATRTREVVATIAPPDPAGVESIVAAQVTPDGRSWVYSFFQYRNDLHLVTGLK